MLTCQSSSEKVMTTTTRTECQYQRLHKFLCAAPEVSLPCVWTKEELNYGGQCRHTKNGNEKKKNALTMNHSVGQTAKHFAIWSTSKHPLLKAGC